MAEQKETVWGQVLQAIHQGAGETTLSTDAMTWLYDRYYPWLDEKSEKGDTPLEAWDEQGEKLLSRFTEIGQQIAASQPPGSEAGTDTVSAAAAGVEGTHDCPYCPNTPIPA